MFISKFFFLIRFPVNNGQISLRMHRDCKLAINVLPFLFSHQTFAALRRSDGTFVFNGNWAINWSGEYQAAGTTFAYRRQDTTTPELITTQGPLTEPIDIMVIQK
jgi:hypothetical protein